MSATVRHASDRTQAGAQAAPKASAAAAGAGRRQERGRAVGAGRSAPWEHASNASGLDEARLDRRRERYEMRCDLWAVSSLERVRACGRVGVRPEGAVAVRSGAGGAGYSGVATCGSVWSCPVCASKINRQRADEVAQAIKWWESQGGQVAMVTLTMQHDLGDTLDACWKAADVGWRRVSQGRARQEMRDRYGMQHFIRVKETTRGDQFGWHVHLHSLMFLDRRVSVDTAEGLGRFLFTRWERGISSQGMTALQYDRDGNPIGVQVKLVAVGQSGFGALAEYFAKQTAPRAAESAALEVTHGLQKSGRKFGDRHRTPFEILRDISGVLDTRTGEIREGYDPAALAADVALWQEYERVSKGAQQLTWSNGLKAAAGIGDKTDEEIAEEEVGDRDLIMLPAETFRAIRYVSWSLLDAVEIGGVAAGGRWLDDRGLAYEVLDPDPHGTAAGFKRLDPLPKAPERAPRPADLFAAVDPWHCCVKCGEILAAEIVGNGRHLGCEL